MASWAVEFNQRCRKSVSMGPGSKAPNTESRSSSSQGDNPCCWCFCDKNPSEAGVDLNNQDRVRERVLMPESWGQVALQIGPENIKNKSCIKLHSQGTR